MSGMDGKRIGIAAARNREAIGKLIQNNGGTPLVFSIQGEQLLNETISRQNILDFVREPFDNVLLTTGIGAEALEKAANDLDCHSDFIGKLRNSTLAVRGSKTVNWLKKHALAAELVSDDGTMENLLAKLGDGRDKRMFLQAYSQDDAAVEEQLERQGHAVYLSKLYHYKEPDHTIVTDLRERIISQSLDAVVFTSKTQVRNLFKESSEAKEMTAVFNDSILAAGVGKVTAAELKKNGITTVFHPEKQKMGAMVVELGNYFLGS
ncbi:uroporphyrinogen-III synthase [Lentibacillus jeotgali]|uniref:uroporphyrinogen-III synthase n=1 Tax=Lentibacillus jeotgali TaxID=558169 RepID=UPI000262806F|nr:uroporphyrinogen-III synthase [Lentibacillus jeotgali]